ncbi:MAG: sensor histidine kinase of FgrL [Fibrobacterota bacterium]
MYNHWMHRCRVRGRVAFFVSLLASSAFAISDGPDILFLNSYHPGLYWSEQVQEGVRQNLGPHEQFAVEHLDSKHFEGGGGDSLFAAEFRFKYAVHSPKLIVSSDDYALRFLLHWRDSLFPAVPVVFCGVNNYEPSLLADRKGYTGLSQLNQMAQTIELWTKIRPRITDVWLITESSATGSGNRTRFDSLAKTYQGRLRFHFFDSGNGIAWSELLDKVSRLGSQDLVYWSELFRDKNGLYIDPDHDLPQLAERSAVPIASHSEQYVVTGAAGGVCNRGLLHGRQAGRLMRRVLAGASPDTIAISGDSSIGVVFRWDQIQRFGIDPSLLPKGTIFLDRPVPVWSAYPVQTAFAALGIAALTAMAIGLTVALRRVRRSRRRIEESEAALRDSEQELRRVFDAITDAVIVHDRAGRIKSINSGGRHMYGIERELGQNLTIADLSGEQVADAPDPSVLWDDAIRGNDQVFEWRAKKPNTAETFDVEVALTSMSFSGEAHLVAVVRDVGERLEARRLLLDAKGELERKVEERTFELRQSNRELEAFSYSVSHDLRAPLRAIDGFALALEEDVGSALPAQQKTYLHRIRAASTRMGEIIDDLLKLSSISRTSIARNPVDMGAVLEGVIAEVVPPQRRSQVVVGKLPTVRADIELLKPLWTNLVANAVKYSGKAETPAIEIGCDETVEGSVWFVRDNGVGFDPSLSEKLFKPFSRLHTQEDFPGTGIGLAIVQRIVAKHGGRIWAESAPGHGATFKFTLG